MKRINWNDKTFTANGKTYHISPTMSIGRSVYCEEAKIELETGVRVGQTTSAMKEIFDLLNASKPAEAAVVAYNHIRAVDGFYERPAPVLRFCACFLNYEGEDTRYISEEVVREKIQDWTEEGLSMESFFLLALTFISEETEGSVNFTPAFSEVLKALKGKITSGALDTPISE